MLNTIQISDILLLLGVAVVAFLVIKFVSKSIKAILTLALVALAVLAWKFYFG